MNTSLSPLQDSRLRPYLDDVYAWHGYIRFLGLPTLQDHPDTALHELFVPPLLSTQSVSPDSDPKDWPPGEAVLATLQHSRRLVVLGDPGGGKSTLINWLAWLLVAGVTERVPEWLRGTIPLPLVLRELDLAQVNTFDGLCKAFLHRPVAKHLRGQEALLHSMLASGRVLVLADGLDEVGITQREPLRQALRDGFARYPNSLFLVTSRIVGYADCSLDQYRQDEEKARTHKIGMENSVLHSFPTLEYPWLQKDEDEKKAGIHKGMNSLVLGTSPTLEYPWLQNDKKKPGIHKGMNSLVLGTSPTLEYPWLQNDKDEAVIHKNMSSLVLRTFPPAQNIQLRYVMPFDDDQVHAFASNWYRLRSLKQTADSDAANFIQDLFRDQTTLRLARTPQLLTLMALVYRVRAQLPDGRALLYDLITEAYLESIDKARKLENDRYPWREKRRWLARVGFEMQYRRGQTDGDEPELELLARRSEVGNWVADAMNASGYPADAPFVESYLDWVARRSGLLLPRGEEQYAFVHLSFQEYFAALYLVEHLADADWVMAQRDGTKYLEGDARVNSTNLFAWANDPRWQETLVFSFESFAHQPKDAKRLIAWLYGERYQVFCNLLKHSEIVGNEPAQAPRADLLARVVIDPHSGLAHAERLVAFEALWQYLEFAEMRFSGEGMLAPIRPEILMRLLESSHWAGEFWRRLLERKPKYLNLSLAGSIDLSEMEGLADLEQLSMFGTHVNDFAPLASLGNLREIGLTTRFIHDLTQLAPLTNLKVLFLFIPDTIDLTPLAKLPKLQSLTLAGTTALDLTPLLRCLKLRRLNLMGKKQHIPKALQKRLGKKLRISWEEN